jgi:hypothetical protein
LGYIAIDFTLIEENIRMTTTSALAKLKQKKSSLEARIQALEARNKLKERKNDTRKKILIGSYYLSQASKENAFHELKQIMDAFLERENDRQLFGLPPKAKKSA